jgi:predicted nucleic acid-binding protein
MVNFWDTSALAPLLIRESDSDIREAELLAGGVITTWWGTRVELRSALERRRREGVLPELEYFGALERLRCLIAQSFIVEPSEFCLERAERLLALHSLRAADAMQLAAALLACREHTSEAGFHCADKRLGEAAGREGFCLFPGNSKESL